jgi:hypothetical protein
MDIMLEQQALNLPVFVEGNFDAVAYTRAKRLIKYLFTN